MQPGNSQSNTAVNPLRTVFMGSAAVACPTLQALLSAPGIRLAGVVSQPDRPQGRNLIPKACPVRELTAATSIPVWDPERINDPESIATLRKAAPDIIVVMAYGQFLGQTLLDLASLDCVNVHLSLLPKYRGAAPIQWAIANGERETGITIMRMTRRMDAGDIIDQRVLPIRPDDTAVSLAERLSRAAPQLLLATLERMASCGKISARPQEEAAATYAPLLKKSDGRINWSMPAEIIERRLRAFTPWPGCYCECRTKKTSRLRILKAKPEPPPPAFKDPGPGTVIEIDGPAPLVSTGRDCLRLTEVQPEGRRPMSGQAFILGHRLLTGDKLD